MPGSNNNGIGPNTGSMYNYKPLNSKRKPKPTTTPSAEPPRGQMNDRVNGNSGSAGSAGSTGSTGSAWNGTINPFHEPPTSAGETEKGSLSMEEQLMEGIQNSWENEELPLPEAGEGIDPSSSGASLGGSYTVQKGDSLWKIAREILGPNASNTDIANYVNELARRNGIGNSNSIRPGQTINY